MVADDKLLREFIRAVLTEDDGGGGGDMGSMGYGYFSAGDLTGPWGVSFGSGQDMANIFIKPFTDVFKTAAGKAKELSQKGQTLAIVAFETVATTLIPVLESTYNEIFQKDKERIDKIREQYAEVYQSNWDAFKDNDAQFLAFCYNPAAFINTKILKKSPSAALAMVSILTGGTIDTWLDRIKERFGLDKEPKDSLANKEDWSAWEPTMGGMGGGMGMESVIREAGDKPSLEQVFNNPKLQAKLTNSPMVKRLEADGKQVVRTALENIYKQARGVLNARSLQQLQHAVGKKLPGLEKLGQMQPQERQVAEQQLMIGVKKSMRQFYVKSLEQQVQAFTKAGVPQNHQLIHDYGKVIGKVKAL